MFFGLGKDMGVLLFYLEKNMVLMLVLMVVLLVAVPGGHMGSETPHHSPDQASQPHKNEAAKPGHEKASLTGEHDAMKPNQEKR
jgi:hypothetical protein